jgi:hypothetical protein
MNVQCTMCKKTYDLAVSDDMLKAWKRGGYIQDVMPKLTAGERELLISGTCNTCFDNLFAPKPAERRNIKITDVLVSWYHGYGNHPRIYLTVDRLPRQDELRYEQRGDLYFAELDGYVSYYCYSGPGDGFGGSKFHITMVDGELRTLQGPWSSRAQCMIDAGFTPCVEVGFLYGAHQTYGNVTVALLEQALEGSDFELTPDRIITRKGMTWVETKAQDASIHSDRQTWNVPRSILNKERSHS